MAQSRHVLSRKNLNFPQPNLDHSIQDDTKIYQVSENNYTLLKPLLDDHQSTYLVHLEKKPWLLPFITLPNTCNLRDICNLYMICCTHHMSQINRMQLSHIGNSSQLVVVACLVHVEVILCHVVQHGCFHDLCMIILETSIDVPTL